MNFEDSELSKLNRRVTALKVVGDLKGAIAALRKVKALQGDQYQDTRLAKFLQRSGAIDAALAEIKWLLDHSQAWALARFGHQPGTVIQCQRAGWCARIHADAALICERAKMLETQSKHEQLNERYADICKRLKPLADADMKAKFSA